MICIPQSISFSTETVKFNDWYEWMVKLMVDWNNNILIILRHSIELEFGSNLKSPYSNFSTTLHKRFYVTKSVVNIIICDLNIIFFNDLLPVGPLLLRAQDNLLHNTLNAYIKFLSFVVWLLVYEIPNQSQWQSM